MKTPPRRKALKLTASEIRALKKLVADKASPSVNDWRETQFERLQESRRAARG